MAFQNPEDTAIRDLLDGARRIAVVGLSPKPDRDSNRVARYLQLRGYEASRGVAEAGESTRLIHRGVGLVHEQGGRAGKGIRDGQLVHPAGFYTGESGL
mgnify:CR=1 FL=1